ncbi:retrovirus-related pol polyprotein from transposon TNT 1-94, partial [Tanacetum coccineum]
MKLRYCCYLTSTPDFSETANLEELTLEGCENLVKVHPSIGMLKKPVVLNMRSCKHLKSLPSKLEMVSLQILIAAASAALSNNPTKEQRAQTKAAKAIACAAALAYSVVNFCCKFKAQQSFSSTFPKPIIVVISKYFNLNVKSTFPVPVPQLPSPSSGKNKGLIIETYDWDEEEVSSDDNEVTEVKALMVLADEERVSVGKVSARNGEWIKISMKKIHTLLEREDNDDRKSFLDYLYIDLNYVEEQRNNLMSKHRNLVQELNTCKEQLLVLKQAKIDLLTMQHVNTEILKENHNIRNEPKELTSITEAWLNSSNKVNQCISEQIPTQKKKILGIDQPTEDTSSSGPKDPVFVKSSADNSEVSITGSNKPKLSEAEDSALSNHDTCKHPISPLEKLTGVEPVSVPKTIKSILKSRSTFKAETLKGIIINEPCSAPARGNKSSSASKTNSALAGKLKNVKIEDDPPLAIVPPNALQNKYKTQFKMNCELCGQNNHLSKSCYEVLFCKKCMRTNHKTCDHAEFMSSMNINQYHTGQGESSLRSRPLRPAIPFPSCIHYGYNDHKSDDCVYYPICKICRIYDHDTHGHNMIISLRRGIKPRNPQHVTKKCETCGSNVHTTFDHNDIEWFKKREALQAKKVESFKASKTESSSALRSKTPTK